MAALKRTVSNFVHNCRDGDGGEASASTKHPIPDTADIYSQFEGGEGTATCEGLSPNVGHRARKGQGGEASAIIVVVVVVVETAPDPTA